MKRKRAAHKTPGRDYSWWLIPAAVFIAYFPALHGGPLWDDFGHITVPELRSLHGLWRIWTEIGATQQYYPLLHSAFWVEHRIWGDAWLGYHLVNVALHSVAALLLVRIMRELALPGALLAGFVFALHPVAVESVAWISEQKNTLSAVFYLGSALVYLRMTETGLKPCATKTRTAPRPAQSAPAAQSVVSVTQPAVSVAQPAPAAQSAVSVTQPAVSVAQPAPAVRSAVSVAQPFRAVHYWLAFALFVCALLTKTVTATLPAALLVVFWWKRGRLEWRRDVFPLVPWFAVAVAGGLLTAWFEHQVIGARGENFTLSFIERILLAGRIVWFYLAKIFWPQNLMFVYPRWNVDGSIGWQYLFPVAAIALGGGLAMVARRTRGPLAGFLVFCGTLVPVLGFFNVFPFLFSYVADHFQYLAMIGIIVPVASSLVAASARAAAGRQRLLRLLGVAVVVVLATLTWKRSAVYRDAETLYKDTVARNPGAWMAYQNLGTEFAAQRRYDEAIEAYRGALQARPDYPEAKRNLALAHIKLADSAGEAGGSPAAAIHHYEAAVRIDPDQFRARYNLGTLLMDVPDRQADAIAHLEAAHRLQPDNVETRVNLGMALSHLPSRRREAIAHLEYALAKRPDLAPVREVLEQLRSRQP